MEASPAVGITDLPRELRHAVFGLLSLQDCKKFGFRDFTFYLLIAILQLYYNLQILAIGGTSRSFVRCDGMLDVTSYCFRE